MQPSSQVIPASQLYTKLKLFGKGAYGSVYKGLDNKSGKVVAIKILNLDTTEDDVVDIQKEITLLSELTRSDSVNITPYHGCFLNRTKLWIIMDFAAGGSVRNLMKAGKIEEKYIAVIAREVLLALRYLHKNKIIHRDIKAANILLTEEGNVQLCDFGVAGVTSMNNLKRNSFVGTPYWMAPEVIREGALYDFKADIWSFGITMYEIATGNPPLANQDPMRAIILIPRSKPPQLEGSFSAAIKEFVEQCVNEDPDERPSADDLLKTKFIRFASKTSSTILTDLIQKYERWKESQESKRTSFNSQDINDSDGDDEFNLSDFEDLNTDAWEFDTLKSERPGLIGSNSNLSEIPQPSNDIPAGVSLSHPDLLQPSNEHRPYQRAYSDTHPLVRLFIDTKSAQTTHNMPVNTLNTFYGNAAAPLASGATTPSTLNASPPYQPPAFMDPRFNLSAPNLTPSNLTPLSTYSASSASTARPFDMSTGGELRAGLEHADFFNSPSPVSMGMATPTQQQPHPSPHLRPSDASIYASTKDKFTENQLNSSVHDHHDSPSHFDFNTSTTITSSARLTPQQSTLAAPTTPRSFEKLSPTGLGVGKPMMMRQGSLPDQLPPSRPGSRRPSRATGISPNSEDLDTDFSDNMLLGRRTRSNTNAHPEDELPLKALISSKHQMQNEDKKPNSKPGGQSDGGAVRQLQHINTSAQFVASPANSPTATMLPDLRPLRLSSMRGSEDVYQELSFTLDHLDEHLEALEHALSVVKL